MISLVDLLRVLAYIAIIIAFWFGVIKAMAHAFAEPCLLCGVLRGHSPTCGMRSR